MKMKYILIGVGVLFLIVIVAILVINNKKIEISKFKYFEFGYSNGYAMNSNVNYRVDCQDKCIAKIKPDGVSDEERIEVELGNNDIENLISILKKYDVSKWNGFKKSDKYVMDGDSFHLYLKMVNNDYISASGYMKWPKNYSVVRGELDIFFNKYIK